MKAALRLSLAIVLGAIVVTNGHIGDGRFHIEMGSFALPAEIPNILLRGLLAIVTIWLIFGVRTRVVALVGAAGACAFMFLQSYDPFIAPNALRPALLAVVLAIPLIIGGGGRFTIYSGGWGRIL